MKQYVREVMTTGGAGNAVLVHLPGGIRCSGTVDIWLCFKQLLKHSSPGLRSKLARRHNSGDARVQVSFIAFLETPWLLVSYIDCQM